MKTIKILFAFIMIMVSALVVGTVVFSLSHPLILSNEIAFPVWFFGFFISIVFFLMLCCLLIAFLIHRKLVLEAKQLKSRETELEKANITLAKSREETVTANLSLEEQKKSLIESESRYKTLVDSVTDYIYSVQVKNGKVVSKGHGAGCVAVTGYSKEEFERDPDLWDRIVFKDDREKEMDHRARILQGKTSPASEYRIIHKTGETRWIKTATVPHYDADGNLTSYDALVSNITDRKKAEQDLQRSEQKFRLAFENAKDAIVWVDLDTDLIIDCNKSLLELLNKTKEEVVGKHYTTLHPPDKAELFKNDFKNRVDGVDIHGFEVDLVASDGKIIPASLNSSITIVGTQRIIQGIFRDISIEKKTRETLALHTRQLETLYKIISSANKASDFHSMLEGVLKIVVDTMAFDGGGIYLLNNDRTHADLVCSMGLPEHFKDMVKKIPVAEPIYKQVFIEGLPFSTENYKDINPKAAELTSFSTVLSIPLFAGNHSIGALNVALKQNYENLSDLVDTLVSSGHAIGSAIAKIRSELSLRESEEKYRTITEQSMVGIFIMKNRRIIFSNQGFARIVEFGKNEIEQWTEDDFEAIIHKDDRNLFREHVLRLPPVTSAGSRALHDYRILTKSGNLKWMMLHFKSINMSGETVFIGMALDVTYRKRMEQALADTNRQLRERSEELFDAVEQLKNQEYDLVAANAEKEVLLKEIHHRVKNNFQVISSLLNIQLSKVMDQQAMEIIRDCLNRIKSMAIVHEKLYTAGNFAGISLKEYAEILSEHLLRVYSPNETDVRVSVSGDDVSVSINRAVPCSLILNELTSNSFKHAFAGKKQGKINVLFEEYEENSVKMTISDNGIGLPENFNISSPDSLGLQLVKTFVAQLEGTIDVVPDKENGSTFVVLFGKSDET